MERFTMKDVRVQVKAVLFDLDGTIFDISERDAFARYQALNDLGYSVSLDDVRKRYRRGVGSMGIIEELGITFTEEEEKDYIEARSIDQFFSPLSFHVFNVVTHFMAYCVKIFKNCYALNSPSILRKFNVVTHK
jgi:phosphoglycolate phosphatase-like HAD superfamily hydrolase